MGTIFAASKESVIHENYKNSILKAKDIDSRVTGRSTGHPIRVLRNDMARKYLEMEKEGAPFEELEKMTLGSLRRAVQEGDAKNGSLMAGQIAGMIKEEREIAAIHPNMVVKIPMTVEGLKAVKVLSAEGIKTNVTLIFSANQALLAARAGATYVSPFLGRLDDISTRGVDLIREIVEIFDVAGIDTEIIAASVRNPIHVTDCALAGADIATVPYNVIVQMTKHPLTDAGIAKFQADYKAVFGE